MRVTPAQVLPLMLLLVCMFGCKGAGNILRIASAVAIATVRVAAIAVAASGSHHHAEAGTPPETPESLEAQRRIEEGANRPGQCTELFVETIPSDHAGSPPPRAAECGGNVLIQDAEGHWHHYGKDAVPAIQEP